MSLVTDITPDVSEVLWPLDLLPGLLVHVAVQDDLLVLPQLVGDQVAGVAILETAVQGIIMLDVMEESK